MADEGENQSLIEMAGEKESSTVEPCIACALLGEMMDCSGSGCTLQPYVTQENAANCLRHVEKLGGGAAGRAALERIIEGLPGFLRVPYINKPLPEESQTLALVEPAQNPPALPPAVQPAPVAMNPLAPVLPNAVNPAPLVEPAAGNPPPENENALPGGRRPKKPFTLEEDQALVDGVERHKVGSWTAIKRDPYFLNSERTARALRDRWRSLLATAKLDRNDRRGEPVPDELLKKVLYLNEVPKGPDGEVTTFLKINDQIQLILDASFFFSILHNVEFSTKKDAAITISRAISGGTIQDTRYLVDQGCIPPLCDVLLYEDMKNVMASLEALESILKAGEIEKEPGGSNPYAEILKAEGGLATLEAIADEGNEGVGRRAAVILMTYY